MLAKDKKQTIIEGNRIHEKDTGSTQVQIALLTSRIEKITEHLKKFPKDKHSHRGLMKILGRRRTYAKYLARTTAS